MQRPIRPIATLAAVLVSVAATAYAQENGERCYGVALAGENAGIGDGTEPGGSTVDYQGDAWVLVETGRCMTLPVPPRPDGTPRRGSFEPLARDRP